MKHTCLFFVLLVFLVGCDRKEELLVKKSRPHPRNAESVYPAFDYAEKMSTFVASICNKYDTLAFVNETSATAKILNDSPYTTCKKLTFRKKTAYTDELGLRYFQQFSLLSFQFENTKLCDAAFDSWIENFGTMATPIKRMQNIAAIHATPCYAVLNSRQLTILFTDCVYENDEWEKTLEELTRTVNNPRHKTVILQVGCAGPVEWRRI